MLPETSLTNHPIPHPKPPRPNQSSLNGMVPDRTENLLTHDHSSISTLSLESGRGGSGMGSGVLFRTFTTGVTGLTIGGGTTMLFSVPTSLNGIFSDSSTTLMGCTGFGFCFFFKAPFFFWRAASGVDERGFAFLRGFLGALCTDVNSVTG